MNSSPAEEVRERLLNKGFARTYVNRVCDEMSAHYQDLLEEHRSRAVPEDEIHELASSVFGKPDKIADDLVCQLKGSTLISTYAEVLFLTVPIVLYPLFSLLLSIAATVPLFFIALSSWFIGIPGDELLTTDSMLMIERIFQGIFSFLIPAVITFGIWYAAKQLLVGYRGAFSSFFSMGLTQLIGWLIVFNVLEPTLYGPLNSQHLLTGLFVQNFNIFAIHPVTQVVLPPLIGLSLWIWDQYMIRQSKFSWVS